MLSTFHALIFLFLCVPGISAAQSPSPPDVQLEFGANYVRHAYDVQGNSSNTTSGFIYISASQQKIREDSAQNGVLNSTIFDYQNTTVTAANQTLVAASVVSLQSNVSQANCSTLYVSPIFEHFPNNTVLSQNNATLVGISPDSLYGKVDAWTYSNSSFQHTFFLDSNNTLVRLDSASVDHQNFSTTRFFNIVSGTTLNASVFQTWCR